MESQELGVKCTRSRLVLDLSVVRHQYARLTQSLRDAEIHFAVKCLPEARVLAALAEMGCDFEVASAGEIQLLLDADLLRDSVIFSAPIKPSSEIAFARDSGIRRFVADSSEEIEKIATTAPNSEILLRLGVDASGSLMPLSEKFGLEADAAVTLGARAVELGLTLAGMSFHVGSQAEDVAVWAKAFDVVGFTMERLAERGRFIEQVDIGGGMPAPYHPGVPSLEEVGAVIEEARRCLPYAIRLLAEPGRCLVATAGKLYANVVGTAMRRGVRWIYVNTGVYHGLAESNPGIGGLSFPVTAITSDRAARDSVQSTIAGYSCDGTDVIARDVALPSCLRSGDTLVFEDAGAYSLSYVTNFCGISGPKVEIVDGGSALPSNL